MTAIPIHYDDYTVFKSPLADVVAAVERAGMNTAVLYLADGASHSFDMTARADGGRSTASCVGDGAAS